MITIRSAREEDADAIAKLTATLTKRHIGIDCTPEGLAQLLAGMTPPAVRQRMAAGWPHWIAEQPNDIAGVCVVRGDAHLYHLFVADACQRQAVARRLLEVAIAHCRAAVPGLEAITVNASTFGLPAYRRLGFKADGEARVLHGIRSHPMRLALNA